MPAAVDCQQQHCRQPHIGGRKPRVRQNRRCHRDQEHGQHGGGRASRDPARARIGNPAGDPKKREDSQPCQCEIKILSAPAEQNRQSVVPHRFLIPAVRAKNLGQHRGHHSRQRRVLWFIGVGMLLEPLHAASDVRRFIKGVTENRVGGNDPRGPQHHQSNRQPRRTPRQKRFESRPIPGGNGLLGSGPGGDGRGGPGRYFGALFH